MVAIQYLQRLDWLSLSTSQTKNLTNIIVVVTDGINLSARLGGEMRHTIKKLPAWVRLLLALKDTVIQREREAQDEIEAMIVTYWFGVKR